MFAFANDLWHDGAPKILSTLKSLTQMKTYPKSNIFFAIMMSFLLFLPVMTEAKAPIDPNGNAKLEQQKKKKKFKRNQHQSYKLQSPAARADIADNLYMATFVGAIICSVAPLVLLAVAASVNLTREFAILSLLGISLLAIIFVVIGIIAAIMSISLAKQADFAGDRRIFWKALALGVLSIIACITVIFVAIGSETFFFLTILLITIAVAILHFMAAFKTKGQK